MTKMTMHDVKIVLLTMCNNVGATPPGPVQSKQGLFRMESNISMQSLYRARDCSRASRCSFNGSFVAQTVSANGYFVDGLVDFLPRVGFECIFLERPNNGCDSTRSIEFSTRPRKQLRPKTDRHHRGDLVIASHDLLLPWRRFVHFLNLYF